MKVRELQQLLNKCDPDAEISAVDSENRSSEPIAGIDKNKDGSYTVMLPDFIFDNQVQ